MKIFKFSSSLMLLVLLLGALSACGNNISLSPGVLPTVTPLISSSPGASESPGVSPSPGSPVSPTISLPASPSPSPSVSPTISPAVSPSAVGEDRKVTICHATGSQTNPYEQITISENAVPAHQNNHRDDIIPAPAEGCPTTRGSASPSATPGVSPSISPVVSPGVSPSVDVAARKVTICHSTGSKSNPFVEITISEDAVPAHQNNHQDDIIPAPAGGCPTAQPSPEQSKNAKPSTPKPTKEATEVKGNNGNNGNGNANNGNQGGNGKGNGNGNQGSNGNGNGNQGGGNKGGGNK